MVHPDRKKEAFKIPEKSLLKLSNHTGMFDVGNNTTLKYQSLFEQRAYVFWYIAEGMEEGKHISHIYTPLSPLKGTPNSLMSFSNS